MDFNCENTFVEFVPNMITAKFSIKITRDNFFEKTETFVIRIAETISSRKLNATICDPNTAIVHIADEGMNKEIN